ncbi:hypothetical protein I7I53_11651 [Histoplasma capsulatum var. duboisii H88]|uniref:Uncharacterized protein n=2 Tax=Ajellomyces capsulatus TaxID=5037 RepID=A0A8A1LYH5_AJEC8|nr:hypothetical protein HCDG_09114 [Histoplasma capsulatum H143]QSS57464.1 hypothetical protein I7I53_11651 [Histoplasma capsulatum var. duboisii H88]
MKIITLYIIFWLSNLNISVFATLYTLINFQYDKDIHDMIYNIQKDTNGFLHLGDDGILRSYDEHNNVLDYRKFNKTHLTTVTNWYSNEGQIHLSTIWKDTDEIEIQKDQIWFPSKKLQPFSFSQQSVFSSQPHLALKARDTNIVCSLITCRTTSLCQGFGCSDCFVVDHHETGICLP